MAKKTNWQKGLSAEQMQAIQKAQSEYNKRTADLKLKEIEDNKPDDKPIKYFDSRLGRYLAFKTEEDKASYLAHPTNKPKEPKPPKKTQAEKDADKAEAIRLKNVADPVGHISDIQKKIDDAKTLRRKTKEGSTERAQYDNIINTLTSEKDSIRNANPKFNLKSLVQNLNDAVNATDTTKVKVEPPKPAKVYKTWRNAKSQIKGEERRKVTFFANAYMNDTEFIAESKKTGTNINELAWKQALKDNNIQFNK